MIIQFLFRKHSYICTRTKYIIVDPKDVCCSIFINELTDNKTLFCHSEQSEESLCAVLRSLTRGSG